mgnify:FL=1
MSGFHLIAPASLLSAALFAFSPEAARAADRGASAQTRGHVTIAGPAGIAFSPALVLGTTFRPDLRPTRKSDAAITANAPALAESSGCGTQFTVAGDPGQQVSLAIPGAVRMRRDRDGDEVSLATRPDCGQPLLRSLATATIGQGGDLSFAIGGLDAPPIQQGAWRGMLHVTAQYN